MPSFPQHFPKTEVTVRKRTPLRCSTLHWTESILFVHVGEGPVEWGRRHRKQGMDAY